MNSLVCTEAIILVLKILRYRPYDAIFPWCPYPSTEFASQDLTDLEYNKHTLECSLPSMGLLHPTDCNS